MTNCGIRLRLLFTTLVSLSIAAIVGIFAIIGCGSGGTYNPTVKSSGVQPAFSIAVTPPSVSVVSGNTANYTVNITETGGFNSPITLSASGLPTGATATFGDLTPTAGGATGTLSISTAAEVAASAIAVSKLSTPRSPVASSRIVGTLNTTFTVTAVGGGITETATAIISVTGAPEFSITLTPASVGSGIVAPGGTAKYIATLTSLGGFSSPVALTLAGLPQNTTATFGSTSVMPTASGATTTVNVVTGDNEGGVTPMGSNTLTLTGTSGTIVNTAIGTLAVGSFSLTVTEATPGSGTVAQGQTAHYIITLTSVNGFAPLVTLTMPALPAGCTATPGTFTLTPTAAGATTTLTITTSETATPVGSLDFNTGGQGGGWFTTGSANLVVTSS